MNSIKKIKVYQNMLDKIPELGDLHLRGHWYHNK